MAGLANLFLHKGVYIAGSGVLIGSVTYLIWRYLSKKEVCSKKIANVTVEKQKKEGEVIETKVLMLGLDNAGKSAILAAMSNQDINSDLRPTHGFNVMCVQTKDVSLNIWEIGGAADMRQYWNNFIPEKGVLVYVIDASDGVRFLKAKEELINFLKDERTKSLPLIIVGNKQDLVSSEESQVMFSDLMADLCKISSISSLQSKCTQVPPSGPSKGVEQLHDALVHLTANLFK